jgi:hypothetical protein
MASDIATATIQFTYDERTQGRVDGFRVKAGTLTGGPYDIVTTIPKNVRSLPLKDLVTAANTYFVVIEAFNGAGAVDGPEFSIDAQAKPGQPVGQVVP